MITDLWIENFKGIGKRQHIPLRPITLLFGANSAGKSTVLHALLYLRELLCKQNLNPTKQIAGENTVNLGGIENIRHKQSGEAAESSLMQLHCRFTPNSELCFYPGGHGDSLWEKKFYERQTDCYYVGRYSTADSTSESEIALQNVGMNYDSDWVAPMTCELQVRIGCPARSVAKNVDGFAWLVDDAPLLSSWRTSEGEVCCWLNIFHEQFLPSPGNRASHGANSAWHTHRTKCLEILDRRLSAVHALGQSLEDLDFDLMFKSRFVFVTQPLICPELTREVTGLATSVVLYGHAPKSPSLRFVSLDAILRLCEPVVTSSTIGDGTFADVIIALDGVEIPGSDVRLFSLDAVKFVAVPTTRSKELLGVIETLRFALLRDALAGDFSINLDRIGLPNGDGPLLNFSDGIGAIVGESLALVQKSNVVSIWFSEQLARVDQTIRMGISQLRGHLETLCYIGPKRSMVPRNLSENVLDEYANWGNGLGAWRWMLDETSCPGEQVERCSHWLSDKETGIGTGYKLVRATHYEITHDELWKYFDSNFNLDEMSGFQRIQLCDPFTGVARQPQDVGEGITQLVPVIAACVRASSLSSDGRSIVIEQPELHLHPSMAARLGDLFLTTVLSKPSPPFCIAASILIETHSEHLILRILRRVRQTTDNELPEHIPPVRPDDVCVLWVDNLGDGTTIQRLRIDERGEFIDRWPCGFFSERAEELF